MNLGSAPPGTVGEEQIAERVREMFGRVAPRYDFLNHLLSLQIDRYWRSRTVRRLRHILERPGVRVMDICCGSGDLMLALDAACRGTVLGCDFCHPMLLEAKRKVGRMQAAVALVEADALRLPLPDRCLDLITAAFGFRNLANYREGLRAMLKVLKPGGTAAILEFSRPTNIAFRKLYDFYSVKILPVVGGLISGSPDAYTYLPASVRRFPSAEELAGEMRESGFQQVEFARMSGGIVALHTGLAAG